MRKHNHPLACLALGLLACTGLPAQAVTPDQFVVRDTRDIIELCTTAKTDDEARELLRLFGFPFPPEAEETGAEKKAA